MFETKKPGHKRRKEIIVIGFLASIFFSTIFYYTYLRYSPIKYSNLPKIHILSNNEINSNSYVECIIELDSERVDANIRLRGDTASKYPKKSYRLELQDPKALFGLRKDDDWILFALYNDHQRLNTKMSMDLWRSLSDDNPTAILPRTKYVNLYLNGKFHGLYLLAEKDDRRLFEFDDAQNTLDSSLIFQAKYWTTLSKYEKNCWEQDWPNEDEGLYIMDQILSDLISFINDTSDDLFFDPFTGIYSKIDKLNLLDFYIFNFFIQHKDFWSKNYFIVRDSSPSKFFLIPWDFDSSIGGRWGLYDAKENRESTIRDKNVLYDRLLNNVGFKQACKERWIDLRENLWSEDFILEMAFENFEEIKDILEIELDMWKRDNEKDNNISLDEEIDDLLQWFSDRLAFCDIYFSEL
jgi:spore coat protein CotH